jgi:hypothetical protein
MFSTDIGYDLDFFLTGKYSIISMSSDDLDLFLTGKYSIISMSSDTFVAQLDVSRDESAFRCSA